MKIEVHQYKPDAGLTVLVTTDLAEGRYAVRVNGVAHQQFDPGTGDVDIPGKHRVLIIEAFLSRRQIQQQTNQFATPNLMHFFNFPRPQCLLGPGWLRRAMPFACLLLAAQAVVAQLPTYTGGIYGDALSAHDGKLRWAVGVQNVQVSRSAPDNPRQTDGSTTIYRHHQMLAYWGGRFWSFHSGGVQLCWSTNGLDWYPGADSSDVIRGGASRMAFYVAPNGRFLVSQANAGRSGGAGERLVREILGPKSYGLETYNVKTNFAGPLPRMAPYYTSSSDTGFRAACEALLTDPLFRQQWQEEDQDPNFYTISAETIAGVREWKAFNWYRLADNRIAASWKKHYMVVSAGTNWTRDSVPAPVEVTSFGFNPSAKVWGARTEDGRYAFVGCTPGKPGEDLHRRWPLAVTTSRDGLIFDAPYLVIAGDMPPQRYENDSGDDKNSGPQYVRGISPGNGNPPGTDLWLTYSMNKEDIWVACVPTPIVGVVTNEVHDDFQGDRPGFFVPGWNTYSPQWAPVTIAAEGTNHFLRLEDRDPCDYASVMRVFRQSTRARLAFQIRAHQTNATSAPLEIDVVSSNGTRAVALSLNPANGHIMAWNGATQQNVKAYATNRWISVELVVDAASRTYTLKVDGVAVLMDGAFLESADSVERVVFRTGEFRLRDFTRRPQVDGTWLTNRIPNADVVPPTSRYDLDNLSL